LAWQGPSAADAARNGVRDSGSTPCWLDEGGMEVTAFRWLLAALWLTLVVYTGIVIANRGMNLLPIFFGDIAAGTWPGQFNLDFLCLLILSALWTAWRNRFSALGWCLALVALFGGAGFLLAYLMVLSVQTRGDIAAMLLGQRRA
jgi:hypothetical protein